MNCGSIYEHLPLCTIQYKTVTKMFAIFKYIFAHLYTYFACLSGYLFVSNNRQEKVYGWSTFKNLSLTKFDFWKFWKSKKFLFVFVLQRIQRQNVHNWNRKWARSALKAQFLKFHKNQLLLNTNFCKSEHP